MGQDGSVRDANGEWRAIGVLKRFLFDQIGLAVDIRRQRGPAKIDESPDPGLENRSRERLSRTFRLRTSMPGQRFTRQRKANDTRRVAGRRR